MRNEGEKRCARRSFDEAFSSVPVNRQDQEARARERQALTDEVALIKEKLSEQARHWFNQEAALKDALSLVRKAEETANKRIHEAGQTYAELLAKVVPLHEQVVELKAATIASQDKMTTLEELCASQEINLGKVEAELGAKNEAFDTMKANLAKQLTEKAKALEDLEEKLASQVECSKKVEKELLDDAANAFVVGFEEAMFQVVCEHPEMDVSNYNPVNHVIDGKVVPRDFTDEDS